MQSEERKKALALEASTRWRLKNKGYAHAHYEQNKHKYKDCQLEAYRDRKTKEPWVIACRMVRQRAKQRGLEFNLTPEYVKSIWSDTCPVFGIPMYSAVYESGKDRSSSKAKPCTNSPTIDRIDPSRGYVQGNVCVISYRANMIKNCGSIEEHRQIINYLERINNQSKQQS